MNAVLATPSLTETPSGTPPRRIEEFTLDRPGKQPLRFKGTRIGFGTTKHHTSLEWSNVTLYKTAAGRYIADIEHCTAIPRICTHTETFTAACAAELLTVLNNLDPAAMGACANALRNDPALVEDWPEQVA